MWLNFSLAAFAMKRTLANNNNQQSSRNSTTSDLFRIAARNNVTESSYSRSLEIQERYCSDDNSNNNAS